jgi:ubiquinone/menaquinone biosynthesis C-methylase UbiE
MTKNKGRFVPALRFRWLTPLYDPVLRRVMREEAFKRRLIAQANLGGRNRVLDLGCGTGTLTILAKQAHPDADIVGIDPDREVLERAASKAAEAGVDITWDRGFATRLPYPDRSFDRVLSSLMTHHLVRTDRQAAFREVLRVLRPGGEFHLVDFGPPRTFLMRAVAALLRPLEEASDHFDGLLPGQIEEAGFESVAETDRFDTALGPLVMVRARRPNPVS